MSPWGSSPKPGRHISPCPSSSGTGASSSRARRCGTRRRHSGPPASTRPASSSPPPPLLRPSERRSGRRGAARARLPARAAGRPRRCRRGPRGCGRGRRARRALGCSGRGWQASRARGPRGGRAAPARSASSWPTRSPRLQGVVVVVAGGKGQTRHLWSGLRRAADARGQACELLCGRDALARCRCRCRCGEERPELLKPPGGLDGALSSNRARGTFDQLSRPGESHLSRHGGRTRAE